MEATSVPAAPSFDLNPRPSEPFFLIAGPNVIESEQHTLHMARAIKEVADSLGLRFVFKASFDKANRTSVNAFRGPGMEEGLKMRAANCPVVADVTHSLQQPAQRQLPGGGLASGGQRHLIPAVARACVAVGVDGIFMEVHDNPEAAPVDGPTQWPLHLLRPLLSELIAIAGCSNTPTPPAQEGNLIVNPSIGNGTTGWQGFGYAPIKAVVNATAGTPYSYLVAYNRSYTYAGPKQSLKDVPAAAYELAIWVKLDAGDRQYVTASAKINNKYLCIGGANARSTCWTKLTGGFTLHEPAAEVAVYVQGAAVGTEIWVTSASLLKVDMSMWRSRQNENIKKYRMRPVRLSIQGLGLGLIPARVQIDQVSSDFPFGANVNGAILYDTAYQEWFLNRFNWAVFNNEGKWYFNERREEVENYTVTDALVDWFTQRNVSVRGHNIFWAVEKFVQTWVKNLNDTALWAAMQRRMNSAVTRYTGKVQHWDVINEPLHGNYYGQRLGEDIHSWMFKAARAIDPNVRLFLNDYNTVEQCDRGANPEVYLEKVWTLNATGAPVTGIGVEAHYSGEPQLVRLKHDLNRLAMAKLPIWLTELDFSEVDSDEQRADYLEAVMREAFSHPSVAGMVLWSAGRSTCEFYKDIDSGMCNACDACLADSSFRDNEAGKRFVRLRKEWSTHLSRVVWLGRTMKLSPFPKPRYQALRAEWSTHFARRSRLNAPLSFTAFHGRWVAQRSSSSALFSAVHGM
ncbi:unnamed protein product [Closterium sp. Yama58-4]|nr:unnamed protein product [Closterium sp. Yama58-4]